jgi:hypothetical protein
VSYTPRDGRLVVARREHVLAALAQHDGGAGVLAHRQHATSRDVGVLQQVERDEAVVGRRLGIIEDAPQLSQVPRTQQVRDVAHGLAREQAQRLGLHAHEVVSQRRFHLHMVLAEQAVGRRVCAQGQEGRVLKCVGHGASGRARGKEDSGSSLRAAARRRKGALLGAGVG